MLRALRFVAHSQGRLVYIHGVLDVGPQQAFRRFSLVGSFRLASLRGLPPIPDQHSSWQLLTMPPIG
jgi:hypothetical protein